MSALDEILVLGSGQRDKLHMKLVMPVLSINSDALVLRGFAVVVAQ
jgi:hypothetical protein